MVSEEKNGRRGFLIGAVALLIIGGLTVLIFKYKDIISLFQKKEDLPVLSYYDSDLKEQIIESGINTEPVSSDELYSLLAESINPLKTGSPCSLKSILLPVIPVEGQKITIDTEYLAIGGIETPIHKITIIQNKGTEIIVPVEKAELFRINDILTECFKGVVLKFSGSQEERYTLYVVTDHLDKLELTDFSKDAPVETLISIKNNTTKGLPVTAGTSILKTNSTNVPVIFIMYVTLSSNMYNCVISFLTNEQDNKILCLSSNGN
jgi:hypothetical protein